MCTCFVFYKKQKFLKFSWFLAYKATRLPTSTSFLIFQNFRKISRFSTNFQPIFTQSITSWRRFAHATRKLLFSSFVSNSTFYLPTSLSIFNKFLKFSWFLAYEFLNFLKILYFLKTDFSFKNINIRYL